MAQVLLLFSGKKEKGRQRYVSSSKRPSAEAQRIAVYHATAHFSQRRV